MNKKGMEISINMIIIIILAITTLIVALGFLTGILPELFKYLENYPKLERKATADYPLVFLPMDMDRGSKNKMTVGFYNNEQADINASIKPYITCDEISQVTVSAAGLAVPVGSAMEYEALVSIPKSTPSGQYSCILTVSQTQKTFIMGVK